MADETAAPAESTTTVKTEQTTTEDTATNAPLTQADVDRIVRERVSRERAKFADYNDLKTRAAKLDEIEQANASEQEKAVKAARTEGATEERQRTNTILARAEARALAAEVGFQDPSDAVAFLQLSDVRVSDDGSVDPEEIKSQLSDLSKRKPYLLKTAPEATAGQAGIGVVGTTPVDNSPRALIAAGLAATTDKRKFQ